MGYSPVTPFRRLVDAAHLDHQRHGQAGAGDRSVNKWQALRHLGLIRGDLGLSDRDLGVLETLLGFHQGNELDPAGRQLVIFPSNATICQRLNGMPCSTMRRHIARLVAQGILLRRDSPNGKRYRRRDMAFGFDLMPLVTRFAEFEAAAKAEEQRQLQLQDLRDEVSLMRRDLVALITYGRSTKPGAIWDQYSDLVALTAQALRRRLHIEDLSRLKSGFEQALAAIKPLLEPSPEPELSTSDHRNEQHQQSSDKEFQESEDDHARVMRSPSHARAQARTEENPPPAPASDIPFGLVLSTCRELQSYASSPLRHWPDLLQTVDRVRPMMGIPADVWNKAKKVIGIEQSAVTLAVMLERFTTIRSPGAYLHNLVQRAQAKAFSPLPMLIAASRQNGLSSQL